MKRINDDDIIGMIGLGTFLVTYGTLRLGAEGSKDLKDKAESIVDYYGTWYPGKNVKKVATNAYDDVVQDVVSAIKNNIPKGLL